MLDRDKGELIPAFGAHYHVVPTSKWVDSPFWNAALADAQKVFKKTAKTLRMKKLMPIIAPSALPPESVLVQEYRTSSRLVFIFQAHMGGEDYYHAVPILFPPAAETELVLMGLWKRETLQ